MLIDFSAANTGRCRDEKKVHRGFRESRFSEAIEIWRAWTAGRLSGKGSRGIDLLRRGAASYVASSQRSLPSHRSALPRVWSSDLSTNLIPVFGDAPRHSGQQHDPRFRPYGVAVPVGIRRAATHLDFCGKRERTLDARAV